jgi:hypothetical protein
VCGMPSHYSEYVQSTSRCARSHPGTIFSCFNLKDPRELSQYEFFQPMHEHMDRLIEPVAVNRFASYAPEKTIPGLLVGILLSDLSPDLFGQQVNRSLDDVKTLQVALGLKSTTAGNITTGCIDKAYLRATIEKIIGVDKVRPPISAEQVEYLKARIQSILEDQFGTIGRTFERGITEALKPIMSFRDIDEGLDFGSLDSSGVIAKLS